jgi:hypothetical protein
MKFSKDGSEVVVVKVVAKKGESDAFLTETGKTRMQLN